MCSPLKRRVVRFKPHFFVNARIAQFWGYLVVKIQAQSLCLHLLSLQPYSNRLGLLKLVVKTSLVDLQFSQRSALTWLFKTCPLMSYTLQDFSLTEFNIKKNYFLIQQSIMSRSMTTFPHNELLMRFKLICDCKTTATFFKTHTRYN